MEIYILRHGIAEDAGPGRPDSERALTAEGRDKLGRVLRRAKEAGAKPDLILSSPYRRALETAQIAARSLSYQDIVETTEALLPNASPHDIWGDLRARGAESVLLASHEPLTSSLVAFLLGCPALLVEMKKAALVLVDAERFGPHPHCVLKWMLTPGVSQ